MAENLNKKIAEYFKKRKTGHFDTEDGYTQASVAMVLKDNAGEISVLFIKRTENPGDSYSGHVAFPGGKINDTDENLLETAIRETREEVGVDLELQSTCIGRLDDLRPLNPNGPKFIVSPYIFSLNSEIKIVINNDEVEQYMWIPLRHLADKKNMRIRYKERAGKTIEDYVYSYEKFLIWGMTGRIINSFTKELSVII